MINRFTALLISASLLAGCASKHDVIIPDQPCLIPVYQNYFRLCSDFVVNIDDLKITIPQGFVTDMASIPRLLWSIDAPNDTSTIASAVLHDYLYSTTYFAWSRKQADAIFYRALLATGNSSFKAYQFWIAVRLFGRSRFVS